jgi:DNA-binding TFAR19-related protein (PDSD5 family)
MFSFPEDVEARKIHELQKSALRDGVEDAPARQAKDAREALQKSAHDQMLKSLGLWKPPAPAALAKVAAAKSQAIAKAANIPLKKLATATTLVKAGDLLLAQLQPRRRLLGEPGEDSAARHSSDQRDTLHKSFVAALSTPYCSGK